MGVNGLWSILGEVAERKPINYLSEKRIAIDLSGWVVQAMQCKGLNTAKNPHLKNLFFRVSRLLQVGALPIFIMEGDLPAIKREAFKKRNHHHCGKTQSDDKLSRNAFNQVLNQCQELLKSLGVPCMKSSGEAEAFCAFLCSNKVVEGVITEDSDAFLYGADSVYKDFKIDRKDLHVNLYSLKSKKNKLHLDQTKLIAIALLLGCDYTKGVPSVGKEAAVKLLSELPDCDLIQRFRDWKEKSVSELFPGYEPNVKKQTHCSRCDHLGSYINHKKQGCQNCDSEITCYQPTKDNPCLCDWHKSNEISQKRKIEIKIYNASKRVANFPDSKVIKEYLNVCDKIPNDIELKWKCPDMEKFQEKAYDYWGWTSEYSFKKCLPIITAWHQYALSQNVNAAKCSLLFKPVRIIKKSVVQGESCLQVQWESICADNYKIQEDSDEKMCTTEYVSKFSKAYPDLVEDFFSCLKEKKVKSPKKIKVQTHQTPKCQKLTNFFGPISTTSNVECKEISTISSNDLNAKRNAEEFNSDKSPMKKQCF